MSARSRKRRVAKRARLRESISRAAAILNRGGVLVVSPDVAAAFPHATSTRAVSMGVEVRVSPFLAPGSCVAMMLPTDKRGVLSRLAAPPPETSAPADKERT